MMMRHHIKFDQSEILSGKTFTKVQNIHCDLDLEYRKQHFHKTLQLMNMQCQTKLVAYKSAVQNIIIIKIVMISLYELKLSYCDLGFEDSNPFFAHDTLVYNDVSPY